MNHLNDGQLVEVLYGDFESTDKEQLVLHVDNCSECQRRLGELRCVAGSLDAAPYEERKLDIGLPIMAQPHLTAGLQNGNRLRQVIAASIFLVIASCGFMAGSLFQSNRLMAHVDQMVSIQVQSEMDAVVDDLERNLGEFDSRLAARMSARMEARVIDLNEQQNKWLDKIESVLVRLDSRQSELHKDLQLLAMNAESEIQLTNQEIQAAKKALIRLQQIAGLTY